MSLKITVSILVLLMISFRSDGSPEVDYAYRELHAGIRRLIVSSPEEKKGYQLSCSIYSMADELQQLMLNMSRPITVMWLAKLRTLMLKMKNEARKGGGEISLTVFSRLVDRLIFSYSATSTFGDECRVITEADLSQFKAENDALFAALTQPYKHMSSSMRVNQLVAAMRMHVENVLEVTDQRLLTDYQRLLFARLDDILVDLIADLEIVKKFRKQQKEPNKEDNEQVRELPIYKATIEEILTRLSVVREGKNGSEIGGKEIKKQQQNNAINVMN